MLFEKLFLLQAWPLPGSPEAQQPPIGPRAWLYDEDPFPPGVPDDKRTLEHRISWLLGQLADTVTNQVTAIDRQIKPLKEELAELEQQLAELEQQTGHAERRQREEIRRRVDETKPRLSKAMTPMADLRSTIESSDLPSLTQYQLWIGCRWLLNERRQAPHRDDVREAVRALGMDDWFERVRSQSEVLRHTLETRLAESPGANRWPPPLSDLYDAANEFERFAAKLEETERDPNFAPDFLPRRKKKFLPRPLGGYLRNVMWAAVSRGDEMKPARLTSRTEDPIARQGAQALDAVLREGGIGVAKKRYEWIGRIFDAVYAHASEKKWPYETIRKYAGTARGKAGPN
jgi:hypothetical protein